MEDEEVIEASSSAKATEDSAKKITRAPRVRGKKWQTAKSKMNTTKVYELTEALKLVKENSYSKFDGTMEMHVEVKKIGTSANVTLPFSAGKAKKIEIADDKTLLKLKTGKIDFDVLLATPEIMPKLVPFARLLGPKGLMPNPKNGTLVTDPKAAKASSGNSVTLKTEKEAPLIHTTFGKVSQKDAELTENALVILKALGAGKQIVKVYIKASMGPAIKIAI